MNTFELTLPSQNFFDLKLYQDITRKYKTHGQLPSIIKLQSMDWLSASKKLANLQIDSIFFVCVCVYFLFCFGITFCIFFSFFDFLFFFFRERERR